MITNSTFPQSNIFFEGNSLTALDNNSTAVGGQYLAQKVYSNIIATKSRIAMTSFAVSGRTQTMINASIATNITPNLKAGDYIVLWEGTNDMGVNALSAADAFANVVTYVNAVKALGAIVIVGTVAARDMTGDAGDLMTRIDAYNVLVRAGASTYGYTVADIAASTLFDTRADASNATYYKADKIHMATAGQDAAALIFSNTITPLL